MADKSAELIQKSESKELVPLETMISRSIPELAKMLGNDPTAATRFARIVTTDIRVNPELASCTPMSFMGALFTAAELKLEPVAGRAYLLPFYNKRKVGNEWKTLKEVQFVLGYKGIADLFYRHAKTIGLSWGVVHEKDAFEFEKGTNSFLKHRRHMGPDRGKKLAYWVMAKMDGGSEFEVMTYEECIAHGKQHSKTYDIEKRAFHKSSPWNTSEDAMCLKTVLIQLAKTLPLSVEMQKAIQADESSRYINPVDVQKGVVEKALDVPSETEWNASESKEELSKSLDEQAARES